jgi:hypothetical protein
LIVSQRLRGPRQDLPPLNIRVRRRQRLLGGDDGEKGDADCVLHGQPGDSLVGARPQDAGLRFAHRGAPQSEVERLPGQQPTDRTPPHTGCGRRRQDGARHRRDHRLWQQLPEDIVRRRAVRLPHRFESRQVSTSGDTDVRGCDGDLLEGRSHRWIVLQRVLQRLAEGECLGGRLRPLLRLRSCRTDTEGDDDSGQVRQSLHAVDADCTTIERGPDSTDHG